MPQVGSLGDTSSTPRRGSVWAQGSLSRPGGQLYQADDQGNCECSERQGDDHSREEQIADTVVG